MVYYESRIFILYNFIVKVNLQKQFHAVHFFYSLKNWRTSQYDIKLHSPARSLGYKWFSWCFNQYKNVLFEIRFLKNYKYIVDFGDKDDILDFRFW